MIVNCGDLSCYCAGLCCVCMGIGEVGLLAALVSWVIAKFRKKKCSHKK